MRERRDARRAERLVDEGLAAAGAREAGRAREKFAEARGLDPACYAAFLNGATIDVREGRFADALPLARRATELRPESPDAWAALGHALLRTEGPEAAVRAFERVVDLEPASPRGASGLGVALTDLRRPAEALSHLRRALEVAADDQASDEIHLLIGLNELRLGGLAAAGAAFAAARARRPGLPEPRYYAALVRARQGDQGEAERALRAAIDGGLAGSPLEVGEWLRAESAAGPYPREALFHDQDAGVWVRFTVEGPGKVRGEGIS